MIDPDDRERAALGAGLKNIAEVMAEIGWSVRLNELTKTQVMTLVEVAVDGFCEAMRASAPQSEIQVPFP
jgi:hypothetical protein